MATEDPTPTSPYLKQPLRSLEAAHLEAAKAGSNVSFAKDVTEREDLELVSRALLLRQRVYAMYAERDYADQTHPTDGNLIDEMQSAVALVSQRAPSSVRVARDMLKLAIDIMQAHDADDECLMGVGPVSAIAIKVHTALYDIDD
jgi:hypothetical protein